MKAPRRPQSARSAVLASTFEQLESRQMLAVTLASGVLTVAGSGKADTIRVDRTGGNIVVKLNNGSKSFASANVDSIVIHGKGGDDHVTVIKAIANVSIDGGSGDDTLLGGGGGDYISGGAGDDALNGRGGDDNVYGDDGDDNVKGGAGNDTLGGDDEDKLWFKTASKPADQVGNDTVNGGAGNDWLLSGMESDLLDDPSGNDQLTGGPGNDVIDKRGRQTTGQHFEIGNGDVITDKEAGDFVPVDDVTGPFSGNDADYAQHRHAFLKINIIDDNGVSHAVEIPGKAGEFLGEPVVHTHDIPNPEDVRGMQLHFHNTDTSGGLTRVFTLGDFFKHWGISLSSQNLGRLRVDADHQLTMTVKPQGGTLVSSTAFENWVIQTPNKDLNDQHFDQIVITYGPRP